MFVGFLLILFFILLCQYLFAGLVQKLIQQMNNGPNFHKGDKCETIFFFSLICLFNFNFSLEYVKDLLSQILNLHLLVFPIEKIRVQFFFFNYQFFVFNLNDMLRVFIRKLYVRV